MSEKQNKREKCFVIMPISDCEGYSEGHFQRVYEDIIKPAIEMAGFEPKRADEEKSSNLIHLNILNELLDAPMAICDLSSTNPNVMFELGIRQAFDKPVALIQEKGTKRIFDINGLRCVDYSKTMEYRHVIKEQQEIAEMIKETYSSRNDKTNINSIVKLLAINSSASLPVIDNSSSGEMKLDLILSQLQNLDSRLKNIETPKPEFIPNYDLPQRINQIIQNFKTTIIQVNKGHISESYAIQYLNILLNQINEMVLNENISSYQEVIQEMGNEITIYKKELSKNISELKTIKEKK